jgi:hypothetical protein
MTDYAHLNALMQDVRFYQISAMEKQIKSQMDIISVRNHDDEPCQNDYDQGIYNMARYALASMLPSAIYSILPLAHHNSNMKNSPIMIMVGKQLFYANSSSLLLYKCFADMIQNTNEFTSQGFPILRIYGNSKHFSNILEYIEGIIYF